MLSTKKKKLLVPIFLFFCLFAMKVIHAVETKCRAFFGKGILKLEEGQKLAGTSFVCQDMRMVLDFEEKWS